MVDAISICLSGESCHSAVAYVLDCDFVESKYELRLCYDIHFQINTFRKVWTLLSPQLLVKWYHYWFSTWMALALNKPHVEVLLYIALAIECCSHMLTWAWRKEDYIRIRASYDVQVVES